MNRKDILKGVIDIHKKLIIDIVNHNLWISKQKTIGSQIIRVEVFYTIATNFSLKEFREIEVQYIEDENL